ncbi:MAG: heavy metal translocating P-type ATPase [Candidatus Riflebacteria bacterium]|nr:heavy metal translocating P-type ATPase [Candidatus Riflebacteria bacterium]
MQKKYDVTGMSCTACSAYVDKIVRKIDGVTEVNVNLLTNSMVVDYDEKKTNDEAIIAAVVDGGYGASVVKENTIEKSEKKSDTKSADELAVMKKRIIFSFIFLVPLYWVSMGHMIHLPLPEWLCGIENAMSFALIQFLLTLPIIFINQKYFINGTKNFIHKAPNMDSLIMTGSSAALLYGCFAMFKISYALGHNDLEMVKYYSTNLYFESAATILTLVTLGKFLETRSKGKTSEAIAMLMDLAPKTAIVERNTVEGEIPVEQVVVGDIVIVKPGMSIPVDGIITEGNTSVDQSALTGESIPVEKTVGNEVAAGTINKNGFIKFKATKVGKETTVAKIVELVETASSTKAPMARLADKVSEIFVPTVIAIAIITAVVWILVGQSFEFALSMAISVLVISCPCALGLATPVAIMVGTGRAAQSGILIKSAAALENTQSVTTVVLDKTGTITEGKPVVTDIVSLKGMAEHNLFAAAASLEKKSEHILGLAVVEKAEKDGIDIFPVENFEAIPGRGVKGKVVGRDILSGNLAFMSEYGVSIALFERYGQKLAEEGKTPLFFATGSPETGYTPIGIIAVADPIKESSFKAVEELKKNGIKVMMLTGDNRLIAESIKNKLGIDQAIAEVLPTDKDSVIQKLQDAGEKVIMVGDGINDAPALVRADVGIAIGAGTDIAIESADIVLIKNDLRDAAEAISISKAVVRNIKQNLFWAFIYNIIGIPLAAGVFYSILGWKLSPMFAACAMSLSSVTVVTNALRLRKSK